MKQKQQPQSLINKLMQRAGIGEEEKKFTQTWEDLNNLYLTIGQSIIELGQNVNSIIPQINLLPNIKELAVTVNGLKNDLETFTSDLVNIKKEHDKYSGPIKNDEELSICLACFSDYHSLNERYKALIFPSMLTITEFIMANKEQKEKNDLADVNVVSDVEVKTTESEAVNTTTDQPEVKE